MDKLELNQWLDIVPLLRNGVTLYQFGLVFGLGLKSWFDLAWGFKALI